MNSIENLRELLIKEKPIVVISGPTAVGKSELSIKLAKLIGGEIISADSMQVYKGMDIGSAKIMPEEMQGISHHLIDILEPDEEFNVYIFQSKAKEALSQIYERGHIPIVTGGTGFYIQSLLYDISFEEEEDNHIREELEYEMDQLGEDVMYQRLLEIDPNSAKIIHKHNHKRVIRALEFFELNGYPISEHNESERAKKSPYKFVLFVLTDDRNIIYQKIDARVELMMEHGLVDEVRNLKEKGYHMNLVSMQGLGYKEILQALNGDISLDEAIYMVKRDTRHFAKRQLTWFRRERDVIWVNRQEFHSDSEILNYMIEKIKELNITCLT